MNEVEFKRLHMCTFEQDPVCAELDKAFDDYYAKSENLDNRQALALWSELRAHARNIGVTGKEFQDAKMRASGRIR